MAAPNIKTVDGRSKLAPRRGAYFVNVRTSCALGFRKLTASSVGTWVARYTQPGTTKTTQEALGTFEELPPSRRYDAALAAAEAWFARVAMVGVSAAGDVRTVADACKAYLKYIRESDGDRAENEARAADIEARYRRRVYDHPIGSTELSRLTMGAVERWRRDVAAEPVVINPHAPKEDQKTRPRSASSLNRDMTALRAALNFAHSRGYVASAVPWLAALAPVENAGTARDVYLPRDQRRKLIDSVGTKNGRDFVEGLCLLPLRPGALAALRVGDFEPSLGVLKVGKDKAGRDRKIVLPKATAAKLAALCVDKLPAAFIFTQPNGKQWTRFEWRDAIRAAVTAAGLNPKTTAYSLRHSTITDLVPVLDLLTIAQLSGTSVEMIEKHYGHLRQGRAADALAMLAV